MPFLFRGFAKDPYVESPLLWPLLPIAAASCALMWAFGEAFPAHVERLAGNPIQTWVTPRYGFQYFLKSEKNRINGIIARAIRRADARGVKVSVSALRHLSLSLSLCVCVCRSLSLSVALSRSVPLSISRAVCLSVCVCVFASGV